MLVRTRCPSFQNQFPLVVIGDMGLMADSLLVLGSAIFARRWQSEVCELGSRIHIKKSIQQLQIPIWTLALEATVGCRRTKEGK